MKTSARQTTALLLGTLLATANTRLVAANTNNNAATAINNNGNIYPRASTFGFIQNPDTQVIGSFNSVITSAHIKQFIVSKTQDNDALANFIADISASSTRVEQYINLVFTHMADFKIALYPREEFNSEQYAMYFTGVKTICLHRDIMSVDRFIAMNAIRHELRHAAMHIAQRLHGDPNTLSPEIYYPATNQQRKKIKQMLEDGDKRIANLEALLAREVANKVSKSERTLLSNLRENSQDDYLQYYKWDFSWTLDKTQIIELEKALGKKFRAKNIVNFDKIRADTHGDLFIKEIIDKGNELELKFTYLDPLHAAVGSTLKTKQIVLDAYGEEDYTFERDAYLYGSLPPFLISYLYAELDEHTQQFITSAYTNSVLSQSYDRNYYPSLIELQHAELIKVLGDPSSFKASMADYFISWAKYAIEQGKVEEAKIGLKTLIQKGFYVGEANLELARISYSEENFKAAETYFKRAEKKSIVLTTEDQQHYADALQKVGLLKKSEKYNKKYQNSVDTDEPPRFSR